VVSLSIIVGFNCLGLWGQRSCRDSCPFMLVLSVDMSEYHRIHSN
jgi:hypothetical protein